MVAGGIFPVAGGTSAFGLCISFDIIIIEIGLLIFNKLHFYFELIIM